MRNYLYMICLIGGCVLASCEKELPLYGDSQSRLNFEYMTRNDSLASYSFVYNKQLTSDTIWFTVKTIGFVAAEDRKIELMQVPTGNNDAVAGKHYLRFDDAGLARFYVIKGGATKARVPVVVLKDPSLTQADYKLHIEIKDNHLFKSGYKEFSYKLLTISDRLVKPTNWTSFMDYMFGTYGTVKHQFMIDNSDKKWDEEYLHKLGIEDYSADQGFLQYWANKFQRLLNEFNAKQQEVGLPPLTEANGALVQFQK